ncbi:MAG: pectin acetylesterase-family hydrolase [Myxococcota bacterium]
MIVWTVACSAVPASPPAPAPAAPPVATERPAAGIARKPARHAAKWDDARCNDGTAFGYAIRPGSSTWVVNLEGGYFCDDDRVPCRERARRLTTTLAAPDGGPVRVGGGQGVLSPDPTVNPTFSDATWVEAHYCSSDLWLGDSTERRPTTGDPRGWYFSGRRNVEVLLESLREVDGLDETRPDVKILVVGSSAGALGVVGNFDQLVAAFPRAVAERRLAVVLDGGWVIPPPPGVVTPNAAKWGAPERGCAAAGDPRRCVYGPSWWPFVSAAGVRVLVQISGADKSQIPNFGIDSPEELAEWRGRLRGSLESSRVPWVWSSATSYHLVATEERFGQGPPGRTFREVLDRFWADAPPEQVFVDY